MDQAQLVERAKSLIDDLARAPRFAGSDEETVARARCRRELEDAGFTCEEMPFVYSQWLGLWGPPLVAVVLGILLFALGALTLRGYWIGGIFALIVLRAAVVLNVNPIRRGWILDFPWSRSIAVNLVAKRGQPTVWLMAHLDSKSQTVPMLLRITGSIALQLGGVLVFIGSFALVIWGSGMAPMIATAQALAILGAVIGGLCFVRNTSPGAVDNVSGVAAVILAAQLRNDGRALGVLITSGEELGLAGALAWRRSAPGHLVILNCDTVDDAGRFRCMYNDAQPMRLAVSAENEAKRLSLDLRVSRLIPGIMADSMAFAHDGRWSAITLSRGTLSTLARIHTRGDNSSKLTGEGAAQASVLLSAIAREMS